jgi:phosphatidylglycerophosphate synthase
MRRFNLVHSSFMLAAALASWLAGDARIAALVGVLAFVTLAALYRGRLTPEGRFGAANTVTAVRVVLVAALSGFHTVGPAAAALVLCFLALDGIDGRVARRPPSTASEFGARFDMETDGLLVLVVGLKLAEVGRLGAWIILPGVLRYAYAAVISIAPRAEEAPRSRFGRVIAGLMMASFVISAWPVEPIHRPLAALAAALVLVSFGRSALQTIMAARA